MKSKKMSVYVLDRENETVSLSLPSQKGEEIHAFSSLDIFQTMMLNIFIDLQ